MTAVVPAADETPPPDRSPVEQGMMLLRWVVEQSQALEARERVARAVLTSPESIACPAISTTIGGDQRAAFDATYRSYAAESARDWIRRSARFRELIAISLRADRFPWNVWDNIVGKERRAELCEGRAPSLTVDAEHIWVRIDQPSAERDAQIARLVTCLERWTDRFEIVDSRAHGKMRYRKPVAPNDGERFLIVMMLESFGFDPESTGAKIDAITAGRIYHRSWPLRGPYGRKPDTPGPVVVIRHTDVARRSWAVATASALLEGGLAASTIEAIMAARKHQGLPVTSDSIPAHLSSS